MLRSYAEMRKIDVLPYCEMREAKDYSGKQIQVPYLNWARCMDLLHANGAEKVLFEPVVGANGSSLIMADAVERAGGGICKGCCDQNGAGL